MTHVVFHILFRYAASLRLLRTLQVVDSIQEFLNLKAQGETLGKETIADVSQNEPVSPVVQPSTGGSCMKSPSDFVLVLSGVDAADPKGKAFSQLIKNSMLAQGFPVCTAYAHSKQSTNDGTNSEDDVLLTSRVKACTLMVIVIESGANEKFVETFVQIASSNGTECVVVPYCRMKEMGEGLSYALSTIGNHNSWCFTDWVGTSVGLQVCVCVSECLIVYMHVCVHVCVFVCLFDMRVYL